MSTINFTVPADYPYLLGGLVVLSAQLFLVNIFYVGRVRKQVFGKELLDKHFGEDHKKATGSEIKAGGYPDTGSGRYSDKLPYKDWLRFNIAQRIHYNFLELFTPFSIISLIAGLHKPCGAAMAVGGVIVARILFHIGYIQGGASNFFRVLGALGSDVGFLTNLVIAICGVCTWLKL